MLSTLNKFRKQLSAHEASAEQAINNSYAGVLGGIRFKLNTLYQQIEQKQQQDETVPVSWLYESNRLTNIKAFIAGEINRFGSFALMTTHQLQQIGVTLGSQAAQELMDATVPSGMSWTFGRPSSEALRAFIGVSQSGSPLYELFHGFGAEAADLVGKALLTGLSLGQNPRKIAPQVEQALGISRNRALVISRNELNRCYKNSSTENYRANADICKQWRWTAAKSANTCIACLQMDGTLHDVTEDLESHVQCRCAPVPVTVGWDEILSQIGVDASSVPDSRPKIQSGADWFHEQSAATQRDILGPRYDGWKNGDFDLSDLVGHSHDADWGHSIYVKPLKDLVK
jgi:SPP1 gp7 family putative phage head morphogenesis protein